MSFVDIDYNDTIKKANQLDSLAKELEGIYSGELQQLRALAGNSWNGTAANMYVKKTGIYADQIKKEAKNLKRTAKNLRTAAETYRILEMMSKGVFGL